MSKRPTTIFFAVFLLAFLFFQPVQAETLSTQDKYRAVLIELIEALQKQIKALQAELLKKQSEALVTEKNTSLFVSTADIISVYQVKTPTDVGQIENEKHQKYFERMFKIFPSNFDNKIGRLMVFNGDDMEYVAFVETLPPNHDKWSYAISDSMLDDIYSDANTELIIHELAHLIAYEEVPGLKEIHNSCNSYFKEHGCPKNNSYLSNFVGDFWSDVGLKRVENLDTAKHPNVSSYDYYKMNSTKYVSDYATINPEEDFAETFMFYVLDLPVTGSRASQKIDFMESHPELRLLKEEIINNK